MVRAVGIWIPLLLGGARVHSAPPTPDLPATAQAPIANGPTARMTLELAWSVPPTTDPPSIDLALSEGRILGVVDAPDPRDAMGTPGVGRFRANERGGWRVATGNVRSGRVRVRVEAPLGATLGVEGAGQVVPFVLAGFIDGAQRSAPPAKIDLTVERLAWDTVEVGADGEGLVSPGSSTPLSVGLNVLSTDVSEVQARLVVELRPVAGGDPIWRQELQDVVPTNVATAPTMIVPVRIPEGAPEGAYALEFRASWEPLNGATSRSNGLSRFLRRRKAPTGRGEASRRVTLVVIDPNARGGEAPKAPGKGGEEAEVDTFDFARPRGYRPTASGRSPTLSAVGLAWRVPGEAFVEATRRDRLRGWIPRAAGDPMVIPAADGDGLAWTAVGLKAPRPDRPHRLTLTVSGEKPSALGVALVAPGPRPHLVLDAAASAGTARPTAGKPSVATYSWTVWPDAPEPVLVLVNRDARLKAHLESVVLTELAEVVPGDGVAPSASGPRWVALALTPRQVVDRFGGAGGDAWTASRNLARYASALGTNALVLSDRLADRSRRHALDGQSTPDPLGPDRLDLALRLLDRQGLAAWVELHLEGTLPGLPAADRPEALAGGLIRVDRRGQVDGPPAYHPLHPRVREALAKRVGEVATRRRDRGNLAGVVVRLGDGPTLLGRPDTGLDDETFRRFVGETFAPGLAREIPGTDDAQADRFAVRAGYVESAGKVPWLAWRAKGMASLYGELAQAARAAAPGAALAVVTPGLDAGPVGEETRRLDLLGLGPDQAWRSVGLDLSTWPAGDDAPIVWRGVSPSEPGDLDYDLATSPELDETLAARPKRGLAIRDGSRSDFAGLPGPHPLDDGLSLTARASASRDEPLGHALAAFDARWVVLTADAVSGREDRVRKFARLVSTLPAPPDRVADPGRPKGIAVRALPAAGGAETVIAMVNDTPYPILLETIFQAPADARVFDLSRSIGLNAETVARGKRVVMALPPFGLTALSVGAPDVSVVLAEPYPGSGVMEELKIRSDVISATLVRLNRPASDAEHSSPPNPGFEPPPGAEARVIRTTMGEAPPPTFAVSGWRALGDESKVSVEIDSDRPHSGHGSLRLSATAAPGSAASDTFTPMGRPVLQIDAWLRADRPETKVRVWIEGQAAGQAFSRQLDVTAGPEWRPISLRASGIPGGGLDSARLRFELLEPGRLWVDDLGVTGSTLTEPERLNARRDLLAALSAFREGRYGDFARLSGSHWARHVASDLDGSTFAPSTSTLAERPGMIRTGEGGSGAGSALPTPRRLR